MNTAQLISELAEKQNGLTKNDIELAVRCIVQHLTENLANGQQVEIRGFGSFRVFKTKPRVGRNPKTGQTVTINEKFKVRFKSGKEMRERVNKSFVGDNSTRDGN